MQANQLILDQRIDRSIVPLVRDRDAHGAILDDVLFSVTSDLPLIEQEYRCFEQRADCTPFQTIDWLATWHQCVGAPAGVKAAIVTARDLSGELLLILPLAVERSRLTHRLVFLGHELCDYNAPLLAPEFSDLVSTEMFAVWWLSIRNLLQKTSGYHHDWIFFDKMPERVGRQENPLLAFSTMPNPSGAYRTRLGEDWDAFHAQKRPSERRRRDRSRRKKLAEMGELRFVAAENKNDQHASLTNLFAQKSKWFARMGVPDLFKQPGHSEFFRAVATQANGFIHVSRLDVGATCVAATFGLLFRGCFYQILVSYDDAFASLAPGTAQLHEVLRYAIGQGLDRFDFTIGDEPFKLEWCDEKLKLYDYVAAVEWLGRIATAQTILQLRAKRYIKNSGLSRQFLLRMRSLANSLKSRLCGRTSD
jgi:CelD/BcsL family acetyltransferase involved in cellulose biosynthesis